MFVTRFAPTPSGWLHAGNGVSFILTWVLARAHQGRIVLRIDDLDAARMRLPYVEDIFHTIDWLGLDYDEGPLSISDFLSHFSQHKRLDLYHNALEQLLLGEYLYACTCSRKQIQMATRDGLYPQTCRLAQQPLETKDAAWRLALAPQQWVEVREWSTHSTASVEPAPLVGDFIVRQKNGLPAYQLASVVDDIHFGVNRVVRGQDLWPSTVAQMVVAGALGQSAWAAQTQFFHHPLLTDANGLKLSKSEGAAALRTRRLAGDTPAALYGTAAKWLGLPDPSEYTSAAALLSAYGTFLAEKSV